MKATLVFPGITGCGFKSFGKPGALDSYIPHGLAMISAAAKQEGIEIDLIDLRRLSGWQAYESEVKKRSPGCFGITALSDYLDIAEECIRIIKKCSQHSIVILGGVHATVATESVSANRNIDYIITGEGEITFPKILRTLEAGGCVPRVIAGEILDINKLPWADRDLFSAEEGELKYPFIPDFEPPFVPIIGSRGCPFRCKFCQPAERLVFGGRARYRAVDNVIEELTHLRERYSCKSWMFHDDLFIFNPKHAKDFVEKYVRNGLVQIPG